MRRAAKRHQPTGYETLHESNNPYLVVYGKDNYAVAYSYKRQNHDWNYSFKSTEKRDEFISKWVKEKNEIHIAHEETKAKNKKTKSTHASAAQIIRKELKHYFPTIKFSVRSDYNSINVDYGNGPTEEMVKSIVGKYEMGHFDGMTDCYNYSNSRKDIPQVKYVFVHRYMSEDVGENILANINKTYNKCENLGMDDFSEHWNAHGHTLVYRIFKDMEVWS